MYFWQSEITGRWSLVAGRWSLVAGRWSLVAGRWSLESINHKHNLVNIFIIKIIS
ncbi:hypothetical protein AD81_004635 [Salmonella enterica subsp. enterica]|nr:hypothetical protein [Salmonella enterica subsp. enterica]